MARIASANPDFQGLPKVPMDLDASYKHPADRRGDPGSQGQRRGNHGIPVAFQVTSPFSRTRVLLPHSLVMHVNPNSFDEAFNQKIERFQTRGGWVEQHWGQDLEEISAEASTGAFMNIHTGLTSVLRQRTIAWDRYRDLHDLYHNNGSVYDPFGNIVLQGFIMLMYDRGTFLGTFRSFEVKETADTPFAFQINWSFKVEHTLMTVPHTVWDQASSSAVLSRSLAPKFQAENIPVSRETEGGQFNEATTLKAADAALADAVQELEAASNLPDTASLPEDS